MDDIYDNNVTATYRRTFIRNIAPMFMRLANWPFNHVDYARNGKIMSEGSTTLPPLVKHSDLDLDYPMLCLKWFVTSCIITLVVGSGKQIIRDRCS